MRHVLGGDPGGDAQGGRIGVRVIAIDGKGNRGRPRGIGHRDSEAIDLALGLGSPGLLLVGVLSHQIQPRWIVTSALVPLEKSPVSTLASVQLRAADRFNVQFERALMTASTCKKFPSRVDILHHIRLLSLPSTGSTKYSNEQPG